MWCLILVLPGAISILHVLLKYCFIETSLKKIVITVELRVADSGGGFEDLAPLG